MVFDGTGILMNNEMDDFVSAPGVPNQFGLIGGEANKIEPLKRPLSSMTPTIVLKDGKPVMQLDHQVALELLQPFFNFF